MIDHLESDYKGKNVSIEMFKDWNAANDSQFNKRIVIPEGCTAVFNMQGHVFNRNLAWDDDDYKYGHLFFLSNGSSLTINGGSKETQHDNVAYFTKTKQDKAEGRKTVYGAVLTGGNDYCGAGCIDADNGKEIIINDVTIIGCKAEGWNMCGSGGGIRITRENTTATLNNSSITGCLAEKYGGLNNRVGVIHRL